MQTFDAGQDYCLVSPHAAAEAFAGSISSGNFVAQMSVAPRVLRTIVTAPVQN
jgi:hypothetical protein